MGADPAAKSVVDPYGRSHDHPNLWVVGAPTLVSGGCNNGTLTFCALSLRAAASLAQELPQRADATSAVVASSGGGVDELRRAWRQVSKSDWSPACLLAGACLPAATAFGQTVVLAPDRVLDGRGGVLEGVRVAVRDGVDRVGR